MSYINEFVQAVLAGDEDQAEKLSHYLQPVDENALASLISVSSEDIVADTELGETDAADLRWWAVRALAHCGTADSAAILATFLVDPADNGGSNAENVPEDDAALLCATAALAFGHLHQREPQAVHPYLHNVAAQLSHKDGFVRQAASEALALCGDAAVPALEKVLAGTNDGARSRAAYALRKIGSFAVAGALFQHLNDPHYLVRLHAYEGLDAMGLLDNMLLEV